MYRHSWCGSSIRPNCITGPNNRALKRRGCSNGTTTVDLMEETQREFNNEAGCLRQPHGLINQKTKKEPGEKEKPNESLAVNYRVWRGPGETIV